MRIKSLILESDDEIMTANALSTQGMTAIQRTR